MDRIDAMRAFVAILDEGSLASAACKLSRSRSVVSRAIAFLEARVGAELIHRTTRSIKLSEAGERYIVVCRRVLSDLAEADEIAAGERSAPRGIVTLTAPVDTGELIRPIIDAFVDTYPAVSLRLHLLDRQVRLIDEGTDIALRIARLADSTLIAIRVGEVRSVVVAAPRYLAQHPRIEKPGDLANHQIIATTHFGLDFWSFSPMPGSSVPRTVGFTPRWVINRAQEAVASAVEGHGITRVFSHRIAEHVRKGDLEIILAHDECPPLPVHIISPQGRLSVPKVRAFVDFAVPSLRRHFARVARDLVGIIPQQQRVFDSVPVGLNVEPRPHAAVGVMTHAAGFPTVHPGVQ